MQGALVGREDELTRLARLDQERVRAAVVIGAAGVGKSRLLSDVAARMTSTGWTVHHIRGSASGRDIPLGAVSHLLPRDAGDVAAAFRAIRGLLGPRAAGEKLLLAVDDAHDLDESSGALIHQMLSHGEARLLLTTRDDTRGPLSLRSLWKEGDVDRLDLEPLDRPSTEKLALDILGGQAAPDLLDALWELSRGHPLYVQIAVDTALDRGELVETDGWWVAPEGIGAGRLRDLVLGRVHDLPAASSAALRLIATATTLDDVVLREVLVDPDTDALVGRGLARSKREADGRLVHEIAHPLYADVVLDSLAEEERDGERLRLAAAFLARDPHDLPDDDLLRAVLWTIDGPTGSVPARSLDAAAIAVQRGDWLAAERIARAVLSIDGRSNAAALVLGRALAFQGRADAAEDVLAPIRPTDIEQTATLALLRAHNLAFGLGRIAEAIDLLSLAEREVEGSIRWQLQGDRSLYAAIVGDFGETIDASNAALDDPRTPPVARCAATVNLVLAQAMTGRLDGFDTAVRDGLELAHALAAELPLAPQQISTAAWAGWLVAGRIDDARDHLLADLARAEAIGAEAPMTFTWMALVRALEGRFDDAEDAIDRALQAYAREDPFRLTSQAVGIKILHRSQSGRLRRGDMDALERAAAEAGDETRLRVWVDRARAWATSSSDPDAAVRSAVDAGTRAIARDHVGWGAMVLHDLVRRGRPHAALDGLADAVRNTSGAHLVVAMHDHAVAAVEGDADALDEIGHRFTRMGAPLLSAEAHAEASRQHRRGGDELGERRSALLTRRRLPVDELPPSVGPVATVLTNREAEVVDHAVNGASSRDIAEALFVSVRTVDNHLQHVYRKLGLSGRAELRSLVDPE